MASAIELAVDGPHGARVVRVSNPERPYFADAGVTKLEVVRYFVAVGDGILAALRDRPTTLERWPSGVFEGARLVTRQGGGGDAFFQRRVPRGALEWVETTRVPSPNGRPADMVCPTEVAVIAWAR